MLLMVIESVLLFPLTMIVTVMAVEETDKLAAVIFALGFVVIVPTPALNRHPLGAVRIRVLLKPPVSPNSSLVLDSVITMFPSVVKAGLAAFCALSAEMLVPPVA